MPLDWAATQSNLGNALYRLGERESGTARLEEAVAAYRAALEEMTREIGLRRLPLIVERVELLLQAVFGRNPGVDGAACRSRFLGSPWILGHERLCSL